jgi:2-dehydro-3-deoxyphosphooctonate aldolase (KDO 8-P synthase)
MKPISVGSFTIGKGKPLTLISGPCVIESREHAMRCAEQLLSITESREVNLVFKASFDKANRSSHDSFRGPGMEEGLSILQEVRDRFSLPVLTDIHLPEQAQVVSEAVDILQIPAFLCRQTDLIEAAARTGKPLHIKKGQFISPWEMKNAVEKVQSAGNDQVILCDRGTSFGYNNLVSDMRSLQIMQQFGTPVSFDASHSVQLPGGAGKTTSGEREFIPLLARCAVAAGIQVLFIETHPEPQKALCDRATVFDLNKLGTLLDLLLPIHRLVENL